MTTTIDIYLSFIVPMKNDIAEIKDEFLSAQVILQNLNKFEIKIDNTLNSLMEAKMIEELPTDLKLIWKKNKVYQREENIFNFKVHVDYNPPYYEELEKKLNINSNDFFLNQILINDIEKRFYDFLMVLNISRVGGFHFGLGFIKTENGYKILKNSNFHCYTLYEYSIEKRCPKFENLDLITTWNWYLEKVNFDINEISTSKLSRAINALSYFYEDSENINKLFWTMLGLEAIYVSGKEGISEQLKSKGQLFLGEIEEFKKRLTQMYDFRSSFIHGSKNFPSYFHTGDALESYEKFHSELFEVLLTAQSMLIATLQKMAKENRSDINFKYIIE